MLYNFLQNSAIPLKEDLDFLTAKSQKYIPRTIAKARQILISLGRRKKNDVIAELLGLSESVYEESGKSCVVIIDEFQNMENFCSHSLYREWSKLLITQKRTMYIILSSQKFKAGNILSKNLSLLFGNFEVIQLEAFNIKTSTAYLDYVLSNRELSRPERDFIVHFSGGIPFYLEIIAAAVKEKKGAGLPEVLEGLLFDATGLLNQRFSVYIKRFLDLESGNEYASILYLVSCGRNKIKDVAHILKKPLPALNARLNRLLEMDAVSRSGDFLKVNDRVFGFWLRFVYQEKLQSLTFDGQSQKQRFRESIDTLFEEFFFSASRPIIDRVAELFRLFENEIIHIEKKKMRLNRFREIKTLDFSHRDLKQGIIGRSQESLWIIAFKNELTEKDIVEFAQECKKYRHNRLQRKIMVTCADIDANTRLRAMEEKVLAWDLNSLNQMFDVFSKPRVIV
jgi:hypothetical protein